MTTTSRAILGGVVGTALLTLMMYVVAPAMTGHAMDIAGMLGSMMGGSWAVGMIVHGANGALVFPLIYAFFVVPRLPGATWFRGLVWGGVLWVLAQMIVLPMMGAGFFSAHAGRMRSAGASLLGHLIYGVALGMVVGAPQRECAVDDGKSMGVRV